MQNANTTMTLDPKTLSVTVGVIDASGRWAVMVDPGKSVPGCRTLVHQARFASLAAAERLAAAVRKALRLDLRYWGRTLMRRALVG